ncbi:MAG TPA: cation diffusion facilitator family transporter [Anaeromyxobacter sp.]|nr:cation diffusion facilitator family transporter [Anaeromyxobacter sp.]
MESPDARADRDKRFVALTSVLAAIGLTALKVVVGLGTGSIGILSEAAHSGLDLLAAAVTFFAVRASGRPADREHAYGHGKVENLSALFETVILLVTCGWIVFESVRRLAFREVEIEVTAWSFAVMAISIAIDVSRSRALLRAARKYRSQALEADALHFATDIWSSSVVIVGLAAVALADRLGAHWLVKADAVAALGVAGISVWVSVRLGKRSVDNLLDAAPPALREAVARAARGVPGVAEVQKVRLRTSGGEVFADVTVAVPRQASFERAHDTASLVEAAVREEIPQADVVVHVEPVPAAEEGLFAQVRLAAGRNGLSAHAIRVYRTEGGTALDVHLEMGAELSVGAADALVERFEDEVRASLPELSAIHVHTEPVADAASGRVAEPAGAEEEARVRKALEELPGTPAAEDLSVLKVPGGLRVSFRWTLPSDEPAAAARDRALAAERLVRERVPGVARVLVRLAARRPR